MSAISTYVSRALLFALILALTALLLPVRAHAQLGMGADLMCTPGDYTCVYPAVNPRTGQQCMRMKPCFDPVFPVVKGFCQYVKGCRGTSATGVGGQSMSLGGSLGGIVGALLSGVIGKLMQPSPPAPPAYPGGTPTNPLSCNIYATVASTTASSTSYMLAWTTSGSATSAIISPLPGPVSPFGAQQVNAPAATTFFLTVTGTGGTNTCSSAGGYGGSNFYSSTDQNSISNLLNGLGSSNNISNLLNGLGSELNASNLQPISEFLNQFNPSPALPGGTPLAPSSPSSTPGLSQAVFTHTLPVNAGGIVGDIRVLDGGATIIVGTRDVVKNSETVGFYGSNTIGGETSTGLVANLCKTRPWATNFLSSIVPATFFDGLCSWRGYQVGLPVPAAPSGSGGQSTPRPTPQPTATTTAPVVEAKVDVWAVPASVPLGARTSIFWNTQGVATCTISSPDGSFSQSSLSGGASTVPLTGATTFTISCLKADGTPVTDYVTVNLAL